MPTFVLLNPHAQGGRAARLAPAVQSWLRAQAPQAVYAAPEALPDALALLRAWPRGSRVVAVGGDGSLNRWLPALLERGHALGLVPLGSGNDVARALGVQPLRWTQALEHALRAPLRPVDVGVVEAGGARQVFLSSLAVGFDAAVGLRALQGPRWLRGQPRYLLATLRELAALRSWPVRLTCDAAPPWSGTVLFASTLNTPTYGSGMPAVPHARSDDGQLDLLRVGALGRLRVLALLPRLLRGTHLGHPQVHTQACGTLALEAIGAALPVAADGEYLGEFERLRVTVAAGALQVASLPRRD